MQIRIARLQLQSAHQMAEALHVGTEALVKLADQFQVGRMIGDVAVDGFEAGKRGIYFARTVQRQRPFQMFG